MSPLLMKASPGRPRAQAKRPLGASGLEVSSLGFGGNVLGWTVDEARAFGLLDAFVDAGHNLIDTANTYGPRGGGVLVPGASESIVGRWLKRGGKRDRVLISTKGGRDFGPDEAGLTAAALQRAVEGSLKRLQTDHIDLYLAHVDDPSAGQGETAEALGASNFTPPRLLSGIEAGRSAGAPYQVLQLGWNLADRHDAGLYQPLIKRFGLGVQAHSALARGFLTGKYRREEDLKRWPRGESVRRCLDARGQGILRALDGVSVDLGVTPAQAALAWLLAQPGVDQALVSATHLGQLADLLSAAELRLDKGALDYLDRASGS